MTMKNLNTYPLPPSMTPDRPSDSKGGGARSTGPGGVQLSDSWSRRLGSAGNVPSPGAPPSAPPSYAAAMDAVSAYRPPTKSPPTRSSPIIYPGSRVQPFDAIERPHSSAAAAPAPRSSFLRELFAKKPSSSSSPRESPVTMPPRVGGGDGGVAVASGGVKCSGSPRNSGSNGSDNGSNSNNNDHSNKDIFVSTPRATMAALHPQPPQPPPQPISQSFSTGKTTYHLQRRAHKGFSTPLSDLFATSGGLPTADHLHPQLHNQRDADHHRREVQLSHLRTDLCSLPCCGILQSDHTRYLYTHKRPPTLMKRVTMQILAPFGLFLIAGWCSGHIRNRYVNSVVCTLLVYCVVVWIVGACVRARKKRVMVREEILWRLRKREERIARRVEEERVKAGGGGGPVIVQSASSEEEYEYYSEDEEEYQRSGYDERLGQSRFEMNCAHRCVGCYPSDWNGGTCCPRKDADRDGSSEDGDYALQPDEICAGALDTNGGDLCTTLWRPCAAPCLPCVPCCNGSRGCHVQLCGLCALAQEAREANLTLPRHLRMVDYITMEPFLLYYPRIVELRKNVIGNFWEHCQATSQLSRLLIVSFKVVLAALFAVSLCGLYYWDLTDMVVLVLTFLQSFAVMFCFHWGWHRFDLSIDAVIKYFAAGFVLAPAMAYAVEIAEYLFFKLAVMGIVAWLEVTEVDNDGYGGGAMSGSMADAKRLLRFLGLDDSGDGHGRLLSAEEDILWGYFSRNPAAKMIYVLVSSYVMAGLVEEVCKYFGFVMVDHPDFCSERELEKAKATMPLQLLRDCAEDEDEEDVDDGQGSGKEREVPTPNEMVAEDPALASFDPSMQRRSLSSIRAGVTVAMVAVALGFGCCEFAEF
ncbi:hypothetical protein ACHAWF_010091 [Thalassiosira exigua]